MEDQAQATRDCISPPIGRPRAGVAAVVVRDGAVLAVRRAAAPAKGLWAFPGGAVEPGETVALAARREVAEETGIAVRVLGRLGGVDRRPAAGEPAQWQITVCLAVPESAARDGARPVAPVAASDAAAAEWLTPDELAARPAVDGLVELARRAVAWVGGAG